MWYSIDLTLLKKINLGRNTSLDSFFIFITDSVAWVAFGVPVIFLIWNIIKKNRRRRNCLLYVFMSVGTSAIISTIIKNIVARERPFITYPFIQKVTDGGSFSFPSGHTSDAFSFATAMTLAFPKWFVILPSVVWALGVGYSRIDLGVHYPSDVLGGIILGGSTAFIFHVLKRKRERQDFSTN
jgi:undecaprenyl-diphosphatase